MYARVTWGLRKVAVVDLDLRHYGKGSDEILKGDHSALYISVHFKAATDAGATPKDRVEANRVLLTLRPRAEHVRATFRSYVRDNVLPALEAFVPELVLLSTNADAGALQGLDAAVRWSVCGFMYSFARIVTK